MSHTSHKMYHISVTKCHKMQHISVTNVSRYKSHSVTKHVTFTGHTVCTQNTYLSTCDRMQKKIVTLMSQICHTMSFCHENM